MTRQQEKLFERVKLWHSDQVRKYTSEPYWYHCFNVAEIVSRHETEPMVYEIALCHDLFEDTKCTQDDLLNDLKECGYSSGYATSIISGVKNLTDVYTHESYPNMNRAERKYKESYRLSNIGIGCQSVKYADIIDNSTSIITFDPSFAKIYIPEMVNLLSKIRKGNIYLFMQCCSVIHIALCDLNYGSLLEPKMGSLR